MAILPTAAASAVTLLILSQKPAPDWLGARCVVACVVAVANQQPTALSLASQLANRRRLWRAAACSPSPVEIGNGAMKQYPMSQGPPPAANDQAAAAARPGAIQEPGEACASVDMGIATARFTSTHGMDPSDGSVICSDDSLVWVIGRRRCAASREAVCDQRYRKAT
jgi:hypothetical protein